MLCLNRLRIDICFDLSVYLLSVWVFLGVGFVLFGIRLLRVLSVFFKRGYEFFILRVKSFVICEMYNVDITVIGRILILRLLRWLWVKCFFYIELGEIRFYEVVFWFLSVSCIIYICVLNYGILEFFNKGIGLSFCFFLVLGLVEVLRFCRYKEKME